MLICLVLSLEFSLHTKMLCFYSLFRDAVSPSLPASLRVHFGSVLGVFSSSSELCILAFYCLFLFIFFVCFYFRFVLFQYSLSLDVCRLLACVYTRACRTQYDGMALRCLIGLRVLRCDVLSLCRSLRPQSLCPSSVNRQHGHGVLD